MKTSPAKPKRQPQEPKSPSAPLESIEDTASELQTPSRSPPLFAHAGRSCLRAALSTDASSLHPGACGLVPLLHDDRPRISVPIDYHSGRILRIGTSRWALSV